MKIRVDNAIMGGEKYSADHRWQYPQKRGFFSTSFQRLKIGAQNVAAEITHIKDVEWCGKKKNKSDIGIWKCWVPVNHPLLLIANIVFAQNCS